MYEHKIYSPQQLLGRDLFVMAFGLGCAAVLVASAEPPAPPVHPEQKLIAACKLPSQEGAMTVFIFEDGKHKCWRWN